MNTEEVCIIEDYGISHDNVMVGSAATLSTVGVEYTSADTKLIYDTIKQEIYKID